MKRSFTTGSYVHAIKRGVRGLPIVKDRNGKVRFLQTLRYFNDNTAHSYWAKDISQASVNHNDMPWPDSWSPQNRIVAVHAYTLMPNHFHLLLEEVQEGGISTFMKKISESMTKYYNHKHDAQGSLFQGSYTSSVINDDSHLRFVIAYILVKNTFELYPDGFNAAINNFNKAWKWSLKYSFSNFSYFVQEQASPITENSLFTSYFDDVQNFKEVSKEAVRFSQAEKRFGDVALE